MDGVVSIILAGGKGTRLRPLTESIAKPAVSFGGNFKLIDLSLLTSIEAHASRIFVLTQYKTESIERHIEANYHVSLIEVLCGERLRRPFNGTADAVRKVRDYLQKTSSAYFLILPGDHIHDFNVQAFMEFAKCKGAACTVAAIPVCRADAPRLGIMQINGEEQITRFVEKPQKPEEIEGLFSFEKEQPGKPLLGSMGIYLFQRKALFDLLQEDSRSDFGKHLLPRQIEKGNTYCFIHEGHWEDIGTIETFYRSSIDLIKRAGASYIARSAHVHTSHIEGSILNEKTVVLPGSRLSASIILSHGTVGKDCVISGVIVDKNAHIGNDVVLKSCKSRPNFEDKHLCIRDGIIIVKRGARIPDGFTL